MHSIKTATSVYQNFGIVSIFKFFSEMLRIRHRYLSSLATTKVLTPVYNKIHPDFQDHVDFAKELTELHTHLLKCKYGLVKKEDLKKFDIKVPKVGKVPPGKKSYKPDVKIEKSEVELAKHEVITIESFFKACKLKTDRLLETIKTDPKPDLDFSAYDDEALPNNYENIFKKIARHEHIL